jgi:hypothetical protein
MADRVLDSWKIVFSGPVYYFLLNKEFRMVQVSTTLIILRKQVDDMRKLRATPTLSQH